MVCEPILNDDYINRILSYLQGWYLEDADEEIQKEYATSFLEHEEIPTSLEEVNTITFEELQFFFDKGKEHVKAWIWFDYIPSVPVVHEALLQWTAGLIWKKYNVKEVELTDRTNAYGYGDQLINSAKAMLKPYIRIRLRSLN